MHKTKHGRVFTLVLLIAPILICALVLSNCSTARNITFYPLPLDENPIASFQMEAAPLIATSWEDNAPTDASRGANDFAFALGAALLQNHDPNESIVISPFSVWILLAALVNATDEAYQATLKEAIGIGALTPSDINHAVSRLMFDLTDERRLQQNGVFYESRLHIANAIFVSHNNSIQPDFAQVFLDYYRGRAMNVDFSSPYAAMAVNAWVSRNTGGLINNIVQHFDDDTLAVLVNAIFFSDRWGTQFNPNNTRQDVFHSPTGEVLAYFMERRMHNVRHFEDDYAQAITLWFETNGGLTIILPHDGDAISLLAGMDSTKMERIDEESVLAEGRFVLPRFRVENRLDENLVNALAVMGVPLFCSISSPLGFGLVESDLPVFLSDAVQVAMIEVDEEGATAAAATLMPAHPASAPPPQDLRVFEMICNTPFVFVLHRRVVDGGRQVMFTGVVNRP